MLLYILKSGVCLAFLYLFYKTFLEKENMHTFKRFYLLGALLTAFIIPFITFVHYVEIPITSQAIEQSNAIVPIISNSEPQQYPTDYLSLILWSTYVIGVLIFGFKFVKNLFGIILRIRKNPKHRINQITNVLLLDNIIPHTFFNYIFLNKKKFEASEIPKEVLLHEETHAKQKHSVDVLFIELLQILFWFNPLMYFLRKTIKLNHEFLADREVLSNGIKPSKYQNILLEFSSSSLQPQLANSINYSSIKKRFTVMKKQTSKKSFLIRSFLLVTLVSTLVYGFSQKKVLEKYPKSPQTIIGTWIDEEQELNELSIKTQEGNLFWGYMGSEVLHFEEINGKYYYYTYYDKTKYPVLIDREKGTLTFDKRKFVLKEKSLKEKLYGNWENKKEGVRFIVHHSGNEIVWDVIKADGKPTRYYPKKQKDSYAFTYGKELWSFSIENDILYDSKGKTYHRIFNIIESEESGQNEATPIQVNNYNSLAKNYNKAPKWRRFVRAKNLKILEDIYSKMSPNQKENSQPFPDFSQALEEIHIHINGNGQILMQNELVPINDLGAFLLKFNPAHTKQERASKVRAFIFSENKPPQAIVKEVEKILEMYGVSQIDIIGPEKYAKPNQEILVQKGATVKQIKEYNALALKYNRELSAAKNIRIKKSEVERLEYLHGLMTHKQKETAEPFPDFPEPPPPPAPPSPPDYQEVRDADKIIDEIIANQDPYDLNPMPIKVLKGEMGTLPPTSPVDQKPARELKEKIQGVKYVKGELDTELVEPLAPPEPKSPLDHVVEMAKQDATFYFEGKEISSDKAIDLLKKNKNLNIDSRGSKGKRPVVRISAQPIVIEN